MKNMAIFFSLKRLKAFRPSFSTRLCSPDTGFTGHLGIVKAKMASITLSPAESQSCTWLWEKPSRSTAHMEAMKPMVPHTLRGGKSLTGSSPTA